MKKPLKPRMKPGQSIKVIGLGGVGSIVARYGAVFLASLQKDARMLLIDGDKFEPNNATRMIFGSHGNKAKVVQRELWPRFKHSHLTVIPYGVYVGQDNIKNLIQTGDIVLMCVDNHKTRKLISDHCCQLRNITLISGGNDGMGKDGSGAVRRGTYGNVQVYVRRNGKDRTVPLTKYHPEIANPKDKHPGEINCTELVTSVPQILFANLAAASGILNALLLVLSDELHYDEACFEIAEALMRPIKLTKSL